MEQKLIIPIFSGIRVELSSADEKEIIRQAAFWQSLPPACPKCGTPIQFEYTTPKTFKYYKLRCTGTPSHTVALSIRQDSDGTMYLDRSKPWENWQAGVQDMQTEPHQMEQAANASTTTPPVSLPAASSVPPPTANPNPVPPSGHANDPNSVRGRMIEKIVKLFQECADKGVKIDDLAKPATIGGLDDTQLTALGKALKSRIDNHEVPF